jgi:hypothetical protein
MIAVAQRCRFFIHCDGGMREIVNVPLKSSLKQAIQTMSYAVEMLSMGNAGRPLIVSSDTPVLVIGKSLG